jgi:hypothetical protein
MIDRNAQYSVLARNYQCFAHRFQRGSWQRFVGGGQRHGIFYLVYDGSGVNAFEGSGGLTTNIGVGILERLLQRGNGWLGLVSEFAQSRCRVIA